MDKNIGLLVVLGMAHDGVIERRLVTEPHLSVVGSTGGGKSAFVNSLLCQLIENYSEDGLEFVLLDLKGNELNEFRDVYHTKFHANEVDAAIDYILRIKEEMVD